MMSGQGNVIAYIVVISWPLIAIWLYRTKSIQVATLWIILGGFMFLPAKTGIDLPLIPPLGKSTMPILSALIGIILVKSKKISYRSNYGWVKVLLLVFILSPFITVLLNDDQVNVGGRILPGLTLHDAISVTVNQLLFILPLLFGRQFFRTYEQQLLMFKTLVIAGLGYSVLMLFEIRMSPQLHTMLYGYFPHSFAQQARDGGFRPVVFMGHGLWVSFFASIVVVAATTLWNNSEKIRNFSPSVISIYLLTVLILCKSMASIVYGFFALLTLRMISNRLQLKIAIVLVVITLLYPTMSILKIFPHDRVVEIANSYMDVERAQSLDYRFDNEKTLLQRAQKRFFFGWGGWGRSRVYDNVNGNDISVTDGRWVITFGQWGWFGFIAEFGLLAMTVFRAYKASKLIKDKKELNLLTGHALLVSLIMIDQLPNATLDPWLWLLAGILLGRSEDIISGNTKVS